MFKKNQPPGSLGWIRGRGSGSTGFLSVLSCEMFSIRIYNAYASLQSFNFLLMIFSYSKYLKF